MFKIQLCVTEDLPFYRSRTNTSTTPDRVLALKRCSGSQCRGITQYSPTRTDMRFLPSTPARQTKARVYRGADTALHRKDVELRRQSAVLYRATGSEIATSSSRLWL